MVHDSLHIICGNCGSLLTIDNEYSKKARAELESFEEVLDVVIYCENCGTGHSLLKYMNILE